MTVAETIATACPPGIIGNPYLNGHFPWPKQLMLLRAHEREDHDPEDVFEILYGGAAGGGKSDAALMAAAQMAIVYPGSASVIVRRTYKELTKPGALLSRAKQWWLRAGVHWDHEASTFTFPNGSLVQFGYHQHERDDSQFQGAEYQLAIIDELTMFPDDHAYMLIRSRLRRLEGSNAPLRMISGSNPGGAGHVWVKRRFVGGTDPETGEFITPDHDYLPATIDDNPSLDRRAYEKNLIHLHPTRRAQLMKGDWDARDPGDYFRAEWFGPLLDPDVDMWASRDCVRVRWWDLAASERADAAWTAGVRMARFRRGVRAIEHCRSFRATPGKRDSMILQTAQADGHAVYVGLEIEGGSGGPAQFETLSKLLRKHGYRVVGARPKADLTDMEGKLLIRTPIAESAKAKRAEPVASCAFRGHEQRGDCPDSGSPWWGEFLGKPLDQQGDGLRLFAGPWTQDYLDRVEGFPETGLDEGDATSGAWAWLEAHPFGLRSPPAEPKGRRPAELQNVHPADRPDPSRGRDRGGHWRP